MRVSRQILGYLFTLVFVLMLVSPATVVQAATPSYTGVCTYEGDININVPKGKTVLVYMTGVRNDGTVEELPLFGQVKNENYEDEIKVLKDNLDSIKAVFPDVESVDDITSEMLEAYNEEHVDDASNFLTLPQKIYYTSSTSPVVITSEEYSSEDESSFTGVSFTVSAQEYASVNVYIADCDVNESKGEIKATTDYQCISLTVPDASSVKPTISNVTVTETSHGIYSITITGNTGSYDSAFAGAYILDESGNELARWDISNTTTTASTFDAIVTDDKGGFESTLQGFTGGKTNCKIVVFNDMDGESTGYSVPDMPNSPQDDIKDESKNLAKNDLTLKVSKLKASDDKKVATATTNKKAGIYVDDSYVGECNGKKGVKLAFYYEGEYEIKAVDKDGNSRTKKVTVTFDGDSGDDDITPREDWNNDSENGRLPQTGTILLSTVLAICLGVAILGFVLVKKKKGSE